MRTTQLLAGVATAALRAATEEKMAADINDLAFQQTVAQCGPACLAPGEMLEPANEQTSELIHLCALPSPRQ